MLREKIGLSLIQSMMLSRIITFYLKVALHFIGYLKIKVQSQVPAKTPRLPKKTVRLSKYTIRIRPSDRFYKKN